VDAITPGTSVTIQVFGPVGFEVFREAAAAADGATTVATSRVVATVARRVGRRPRLIALPAITP
jgi:hypothetical protein